MCPGNERCSLPSVAWTQRKWPNCRTWTHRRVQREQEPGSPFVFVSERGAPFTTAGFSRIVERAGAEAKLGFKAHPHMLRHACGYALANKGHDTRALQAYLGHKNIQHTVRYTELSPTRFKDFWRE
jgi:site-specific recombinase XerD